MICQHCGMDSQTTNVCEWCKKPLGQMANAQNRTVAMPINAPQQPPTTPGSPLDQTQPVQAPPAPQYRTSLTGETIEVTPPAAQPQQTRYLDNMRSANTTMPAAAYTAAFVKQRVGSSAAPFGERLDLFLALAMPTMALCVLCAHLFPNQLTWIGLGAAFFVSLFMGATAVIPSYDESFADCAIVLVVSFLLGPMIAIAIYLIVGAIKQEMNWAMIGLLAGLVCVRMLILLTSLAGAPLLLAIVFAGFMDFLGFFGVCIAFTGWFVSNFFRPVNEN